MYEPNGEVYFHHQTKDGIKNGESFTYFEGLLVLHGQYKNDQKNGRQISYYATGKIFSEENYLNDRLDGMLKDYDTLGNISDAVLYRNGVVVRHIF